MFQIEPTLRIYLRQCFLFYDSQFYSGMNDWGNVYAIAGLYTDSYSIWVSSLVAFVLEIALEMLSAFFVISSI